MATAGPSVGSREGLDPTYGFERIDHVLGNEMTHTDDNWALAP